MDEIDLLVERVGSAPWYRLLGMKIGRDGDQLFVEMEVEEKHLQALGVAHGGAIASMLDSAIGLNINKKLVGKGKIAVTSQLNIHYLKSLKKGKAKAIGKAIYLGSKVAVGYGELWSGEDLIAIATANFAIRDFE